MALPFIRQRRGLLFAAVVLGHIILISAQVNSRAGVPVLEAVTFGVFSEVQRGTMGALNGVVRTWRGYVDLRKVRAENEVLKQRLDGLQIELQTERALAERSGQLQELLALRQRAELPMTGADIIGVGASPDFRTVTIGKGSDEGLQNDMAVVAPDGVVGRVVTPGRRAAKVQLLIDRNAAAGALIERTRLQGVVLGTGEDLLRLEYVAELGDVREGDAVVTSGLDGIYPKGFVIGHVETVERSGGAFKLITVRPAVDLRRLESVLIVLQPPMGADGAGDE
jgi:rod shape-determining protein MreC